ncbi:hypothetical protein PIB30_031697 [Stylosanthes scabra]|uniref:Uncharacterized protein n=1 Tax=Stylosanthes scabra TaxID=79078 RepID=A0ABU6RC73_9FABA|nr:hypothetical protein [Stylosanthes scabra]
MITLQRQLSEGIPRPLQRRVHTDREAYNHKHLSNEKNIRSQGQKKQKAVQQKCYYKYNKVSGHDTKDCKDLLEARRTNPEGIKSMNMWTGKNKEMKNVKLRQRIDKPEKDDPKRHRVHREIAIVSRGIPKKRTPI